MVCVSANGLAFVTNQNAMFTAPSRANFGLGASSVGQRQTKQRETRETKGRAATWTRSWFWSHVLRSLCDLSLFFFLRVPMSLAAFALLEADMVIESGEM